MAEAISKKIQNLDASSDIKAAVDEIDTLIAKCEWDNAMNINEFTAIVKALLHNENGKPYPIDSQKITEIFNIFNKSGDGSISKEEFAHCWNAWIKKIVQPVSALLVIDVQNDFITGSLAITNCPAKQDGAEVVAPINKLIETCPFDSICYSLDWHPTDHVSFVDNINIKKLDPSSPITNPSKANLFDKVVFTGPPKTDQILWPRHCVQESWGSEFHKDLIIHPKGEIIKKGINPEVDSYSAFFDNAKLGKTPMDDILRKAGVTDVYCCGIATDVCVGYTAFHALELGFRTVMIDDCCRGIVDSDIKNTFDRIRSENGAVVQANEVGAMVQGKDRRVELGYAWALELKKSN